MSRLDIEFITSRLGVVSPYGERLRRQLKVYGPEERRLLEEEYDRVDAAVELFARKRSELFDIKSTLSEFKQLQLTLERIEGGHTLSVMELHEVKIACRNMERLRGQLERIKWNETVKAYALESARPVVDLLDPDREDTSTFHIYSSYSKRLGDIREQLLRLEIESKRKVKEVAAALAEEGYTVAQGVIRVRATDAERIEAANSDPRLIYRSDTGQAKGYTIAVAAEYERRMEALRTEEEEEEFEVRTRLTLELAKDLPMLIGNFDSIGRIDLLIAKTQFTVAFRLTRPHIGETVRLGGARHLKVQVQLEKQGKKFTPIDIELSGRVNVITGANMGGKTVSIKLIGQMILLAQMGFFVPCETAEIVLFDRIFLAVGDMQSIDLGLSTFGAEILRLRDLLRSSFDNALLLIDELARGTNPDEGAAISRALIEHLMTLPVTAVITTHFDGLTEVSGTTHYQVIGLSEQSSEAIAASLAHIGEGETDKLRLHEFMDYRLRKALPDKQIPKEALRISELLGLEPQIVARARRILGGYHE
ncbi:MAG: hypothetical protein Q4A52_01280 [Bacillota bacterium]|nr:hypothetical protein [Bacillota bacterium]